MSFILEAEKGKRRTWIWYVLGVLFVMFGFLVGQVPLFRVVQSYLDRGAITQEAVAEFYSSANFESIGMSSAVGLLLLLVNFVIALVALYVFVVFVHGRKFKSLVTSRAIHWEKLVFGFILWLLLSGLAEVVMYLRDPGSYHVTLDFQLWLPLMLVVLFVLPLQTCFEELFVRGYLMQAIGLAANKPWITVVLTSVFFGIMHASNPEVKEFGIGIMMVYYISVGLFLAVITILDDGLELALGIHAATNIYGAGFVSFKGSALQTDTILKVDIVDPIWMTVLMYISIVVFVIIIHRRYQIKKWDVLFLPVKTKTTTIQTSEDAV